MIKDFEAILTTKEQLTEKVWRFVFSLENGETLEFKPGQYLLLKIENSYRQYSISSSPSQNDSFEIIMEMIEGGLASVYLFQLPVGARAHFKGPAGVFVLRETPKEKIFIGTGTGIAPLKSMILAHLETARDLYGVTGQDLHLFFGLKDKKNMYLYEELSRLAIAHQQFHFTMCLSQEEGIEEGSVIKKGRVNLHIDEFLKSTNKNVNDFEYYICGSKPAVDSLKEYVTSLGVTQDNIFFERFTL